MGKLGRERGISEPARDYFQRVQLPDNSREMFMQWMSLYNGWTSIWLCVVVRDVIRGDHNPVVDRGMNEQ